MEVHLTGGSAVGPLPQLHRFLIAALVLVLSLGAGVWLAAYLDLPLGGVGVGLGAGCLLAYVLVHDFGHPDRSA
jgi:hypothetical protein